MDLSALARAASLGLVGVLLAAGADAQSLEKTFHFRFPAAGVCVDATTGCVPWDETMDVLRREMHPVVPVRVARFLLPKGEDLVRVRMDPVAARVYPFEPRIAPQQIPMTYGAFPMRRVDGPEGEVYPESWLGEPRVTRFRGYDIVEVPIHPLRVTADGEALTIERATLRLETKPKTYDAGLWRGEPRDLAEAISRVDNVTPGDRLHIVKPEDEIGYLIIGPRALVGTMADTPLKPLIEDKDDRHLQVELAALEDVSPRKDPGEIRNYIKQRYRAASIDYVLIVGDKSHFPWKYVKSGMRDRSDPVPTDQWYACLDGEFDAPSRIDWACEVSVGRVGARTRADVAAWVQKTLELQASGKAGRNRAALSFGEKLDNRTLGDRVLDFLIRGHTKAPRTTGFPTSVQFTKLYETFRKEISSGEFIQALNGGDYHVVNHLGHANETYVFRTKADQLPGFRSRPAFYYTQGCYPNDPDTDNWTIRAVRMPSYGPAAMIANTRYGWYAPGSTDEGSSSVLHRAFWSMRFANGVRAIGTMNHRAKEAVIATDRSDIMIYTALESTLIGDPELDLGF